MPINAKKFLHAPSLPSWIASAQLGLLSHHPSSMEHWISSFPGREDHRERADKRAAQSKGLLPTNQAAWSFTILLRGPREHLLSPHFYHHLRILKAGARTPCVHNDLSFCQYDPVKICSLSFFPEEHGLYHGRILKWERMKVRKHISGPVITRCTVGTAPWEGKECANCPQRTNQKHPVDKLLEQSQQSGCKRKGPVGQF